MPGDENRLSQILEEVREEVERAHSKYGKFNSLHEAYAVLLEESEEFWETLRRKEPAGRSREEAIQVAAAVVAMIQDLL